MIVTPSTLDSLQRCGRIYRISQTHTANRYKPTALFSECARAAIFSLSNGSDPDKTIQLAVNRFLSSARQPGLDLPDGTDSYCLAQDLASTLRTMLTFISTLTLLTVRRIESIPLANGDYYQPLSWIDDSGELHVWNFTDSISNDDAFAAIHSSFTWCDMAMIESPCSIHLINIGRTSGSHRASPWARVYESKTIAGQRRFQKRDGSPLEGDWTVRYFQDNPRNDPAQWVELMRSDGVFDKLVRHIHLSQPSEHHVRQFHLQLATEINRMKFLNSLPLEAVPMTRSSCDSPACQFQDACYSQTPDINLDGVLAPLSSRPKRFSGVSSSVEVSV